MALDHQTLRTRSLTAVIFVIVMLAGLLWNSWSFLVLFTIIHFGCWFEFLKLLKKITEKNYLLYSLFGLVYISLPVLMMMDLRSEGNLYKGLFIFSGNGRLIPCTIIFSIWINDTMAYLVGSLIGKTPFSKISPKKTWEGTLGGILLCVVVISAIAWITKALPVQQAAMIATLCGISGTAGDLLESKLKRSAQVKDSGTFMPGHGGFLDRFDSLLTSVPLVWIYIFFSS